MGKRANPALVGGFVIGAVVLAVVGVALFGSGRLFRTTYPYVLFFTGDVNGLKVGAPVKLKGVQIGRVSKVLLNASQQNIFQIAAREGSFSGLRIPVVVEFDADALTQRGGHLTPEPETMKQLVDLGLRARLSMESFVTGVLYIELDMLPNSPARFVADSTVAYPEIPTLPTPLEEVQMQAAKFLTRLQEVDFKTLIDSLGGTVAGLDRLVNSPHLEQTLAALPETMKKLDQAIADASLTLASFRDLSHGVGKQVEPALQSLQSVAMSASDTMLAAKGTLDGATVVLEPDSPVMHQFGQTLTDLSSAALAIRRFAEELDRNPSALLRGKSLSEEAK